MSIQGAKVPRLEHVLVSGKRVYLWKDVAIWAIRHPSPKPYCVLVNLSL